MPSTDIEEFSPKASQILDGALATFMELGFDGASVDEIARRARVSKPTLYNHFADKRTLFVAAVRRVCSGESARIFTVDLGAFDIEVELQAIGRRLVTLALSPFAQNLFRLIVSESARFPELGRVFHASGPELGTRRLAALLAAAVGRGQLAIDDVDLAANQFVELCKAHVFYRSLFRVVDEVQAAEANRIVDAAVAMILKAYRP